MQKVARNSQILEIIKDWSFKIDPLADLNTTACSGKASLPSLSHNVTRWRQKKKKSSSSCTSQRNGLVTPVECKFLENGEYFLLLNSGEHDVDRFLVFGTESDLDGVVKYKIRTGHVTEHLNVV